MCFEEKEYQTESKRNEINWRSYFWKESNPWNLECTSGEIRAAHKGGRHAHPPRERDFLPEQDPGDLDPKSRHKRGGHEVGARLPPRRALHPHGPPVAPPTYSFLLYIPTYPQTIRYGAKNLIPPPQLSVSTRSHLGACSGAPPEGASITEGFYINTIASPMKCE